MSESNCVLRLTLKNCFKTFNLENDTRPGNELLTDQHRAAARWLPTTALQHAIFDVILLNYAQQWQFILKL